MITAFIILGVIFIIYLFFYEQTAPEYRINQSSLAAFNNSLLLEQAPIVITDVPPSPIWTLDDINQRKIQIKKKPIIIQGPPPSTRDSRYLGDTIGADIWMDKVLMNNNLSHFFMKEIRATWGRRGLQPIHGWTAIIVTEGTSSISLMHKKADKYLPYNWRGLHPTEISRSHTPFLSDIKYIDIILRPGTVLLIPPHWRMAITPDEGSLGLCLEITLHHPMSLLMGAIRGY
jgi:hypothetical protein